MTLNDTVDLYLADVPQLAPDNKIYISTYSGGVKKLHVINEPDSFGLACDFRLYGVNTNCLNSISLPYFPNYRLGAQPGACDTLTTISNIELSHPVFASLTPNPVSDKASLLYYTQSNTVNVAKLYDLTGKLLWMEQQNGSNGMFSINTSDLPAGIYFVTLSADNSELLNKKIVIYR